MGLKIATAMKYCGIDLVTEPGDIFLINPPRGERMISTDFHLKYNRVSAAELHKLTYIRSHDNFLLLMRRVHSILSITIGRSNL